MSGLSYDYPLYVNDLFPPNTDQKKIDEFLHKIKDLILVTNFAAVSDDPKDDCFLLFKGQIIADLGGHFPFPSSVFFGSGKSKMIGKLKYHSKPIRYIKPENCYSSIEQYQNRTRVVDVKNSAVDNIIEDVADKNSKAENIVEDVAGKESKDDTTVEDGVGKDSKAENIVEDVAGKESKKDSKDVISKYALDDKHLPIPKSSSKKLITNRQLNFTLSPVDKHNKKEFPYRLENYEINGTWNHHQSIILDVILDRIFNLVYQRYKKPPRSWRSKITNEMVDKFSGGTINPNFISYLNLPPIEAYAKQIGYDVREELKKEYDFKKDQMVQVSFEQFVDNHFAQSKEYQEFKKTMQQRVGGFYQDFPIRLNVVKLFEAYPLLKPYRYKKLIEHLKKIEQTEFKMNYKVKFVQRKPIFDDKGKMTDRGQLIDLNYQMHDFQHLFEVNAGKDEIVLNFDTPLGKLIIHNMLILDTDWLPVEAMSLSKNAYFIYKRFIFNKVFGKHKAKTLELKFEDLKAFLNVKWKNNSGVQAIIKKALNGMVKNKLIAGYSSNKNFVNKRSYKLYFENGVKDLKEKKEENAKKI